MKYLSIVFIMMMMLSCTTEETTIQQLYVDSETNDNYLMLDIPTSVVSLPDNASDASKEAYKSVKKVNLLAFKINETNKADFKIEKTKVLKILKNPNYIEMMRVNSKGTKVTAKYIGSENSIDELILFASDNEHGFGLARVLGDNMKPENMMALLEDIKDIDKNSNVFKKLEDFLK